MKLRGWIAVVLLGLIWFASSFVFATRAVPPDRLAAQKFSCASITSILAQRQIVNPIGLSTEQTSELIRRIIIVGDWEKFEAVIIGGSRTHHRFGHKPETREDGSIGADLDIQFYPNQAWRRSRNFDREIYPILDDVARTLRRPPYASDVELPRTELIQRRDLLTSLTAVANRLSSTELETSIAARFAEEAERRKTLQRDDEKKFWLRELFKSGVPESALHTTEAIVILRDQGAATQALEASLKARGFRNILIISRP